MKDSGKKPKDHSSDSTAGRHGCSVQALGFAIVLWMSILVLPLTALAYEDSLEKDLQKSLADSRVAVLAAQGKLSAGSSISLEIAKLKTLAENIRITDLLLQERFRIAEEKQRPLAPGRSTGSR